MGKEMIQPRSRMEKLAGEAIASLFALAFCSIHVKADEGVRIRSAHAIAYESGKRTGYSKVKPGNNEAAIDDGVYAEIATIPGGTSIVRDHLPTDTKEAYAEYETGHHHHKRFEPLEPNKATYVPQLRATLTWTPAGSQPQEKV